MASCKEERKQKKRRIDEDTEDDDHQDEKNSKTKRVKICTEAGLFFKISCSVDRSFIFFNRDQSSVGLADVHGSRQDSTWRRRHTTERQDDL